MTSIFTHPIHLYRSLLRETTYLFDSNARTYFHQYITSSFRDQTSIPKSSLVERCTRSSEGPPTIDERHQLKRGRKLLSTLQRANEGYITPLENVLNRTYGRKGRRRRDLMAEIMVREPTENEESKAVLEQQRPRHPTKQFEEGWTLPPRFDALMRSQSVLQSHLDHNGKIKIKPAIAEKNAWGYPMPACRIKNQTKKWYAKNAKLLLPYLSEKEFNEIKARTEGAHLTVPPRRPLAQTRVYAAVQEQPGLIEMLVAGPGKEKTYRQKRLEGDPHKLKPRFLKRVYARTVLRHTPVAMARPDGLGIMFRWESGRKNLLQSIQLAEDEEDDQVKCLFDPPEDLRIEQEQ